MKLHTYVNIEPLCEKIDYKSQIFTIGSCFAQRMGDNLLRSKFQCSQNPSGVLYNPLSILRTLERYADEQFIGQEELQEGEGGYFHFDFHSSLNDIAKDKCLKKINNAIMQGAEMLKNANIVILTLGTSWVYSLATNGEIVANCHKRPAREFTRSRLKVDQILSALNKMANGALKNKQIILTLSPIRHMADGLIENSSSKASLRVAIEEFMQNYSQAHYFPAYELMMDELRDYRFYDVDMIHPSPLAVDYIWSRFCDFGICDSAKARMEQIEKVIRATEHRPINPASEAHLAFCRSQLISIEKLGEGDFENEKRYFIEQLKINS